MRPDPVVQETRDNFARIAEECGNDFDRIVERFRHEQSEHSDKLVSRPGAINRRGPKPDSADPATR
jgi:hypothetical protein